MVISHQLFLDISSYPQPTSRAKTELNKHKRSTTNHWHFRMHLCDYFCLKMALIFSQKLHRQRILLKNVLRPLHRISNRDQALKSCFSSQGKTGINLLVLMGYALTFTKCHWLKKCAVPSIRTFIHDTLPTHVQVCRLLQCYNLHTCRFVTTYIWLSRYDMNEQ